jgi:hypothetical protein
MLSYGWKIEMMEVGTNRPSRNVDHLFKLFELKIPCIEPDQELIYLFRCE